MLKFLKNRGIIANFSISCKSYMKECRIRLTVSYILLLIAFFLGVFMAIRLNNNNLLERAEDFGYLSFSLSNIASFSTFFWRIISILILLVLIYFLTLTPFLYLVAKVVLLYRSYLLGLNVILIIITNGFGGFFTTVFIILPLQVIMLGVLSTYFCVMSKNSKTCFREKRKTILTTAGVLFALCILESLLLMIFGANVILVI